MPIRVRTFCRAAALALIFSGLLAAALFPRLSVEELTAHSQVIIQGTVVRSWAAWDASHKYIWTHYEIALSDVLRGGRAVTFTVSEPGGTLEGITQQISGALSYTPGESDFLFLYQTPIGYWRVVGGPQGKFAIGAGGRVRGGAPAAPSAEIVGRAPAGTALAVFDGLSVAEFKNRVRQLAAAYPYQGQ